MRLKLARGSTVIRRHYHRISAPQSDRFLPADRSWGNVARLQTAASSRITTSPPRVLRRRSSKGGFGGCSNAASPEAEWRQRADNVGCTASVQIDAAQARRMDMRSDQERSDRAGDGTEEVRFPRHAGLARKNAPEDGAIKRTDHQCSAQSDQ